MHSRNREPKQHLARLGSALMMRRAWWLGVALSLSCSTADDVVSVQRAALGSDASIDAGIDASVFAPADCPTTYNVIEGTSGDDVLTGTSSSDCIIGYGGNDTITGGDGRDYIVGGAGNDTINAGAGDDTLFGNEGDDTLIGGIGADVIDGGNGNNTIDGGYGDDTITTGDGVDSVIGGVGADVINTGAGNDTIDAGDGNDIINAGTGDDSIIGGVGADTIHGDAGNDTISGDDGNDIIYGDDGNDVIAGGIGADTISGDAGNDAINDTVGTNTIRGGTGTDACTASDCEISQPPADCTTDSQCATNQLCALGTGICVYCLRDDVCADNNTCTLDTCIPTTGCDHSGQTDTGVPDANCDGLDDDCDGVIDEDAEPSEGPYVGSPCDDDTDCNRPADGCNGPGIAGGFCYTEADTGVPGGMCLTDCNDTPCPEGSWCLAGGGINGETLCAPSCGTDGSCRDERASCILGYNDGAYSITACIPWCTTDADCTGGRFCNYGSCTVDPPYCGGYDNNCDGYDGDCDGVIDDDTPPLPACVADGCSADHTCPTPGDACLFTQWGWTCVALCMDDAQCTTGCNTDTHLCNCEPEGPSCDGVDDDCDGMIDEDIGPESTTCDQVDNDCDGVIDEGVGPEAATCDQVDNDCDGIIDEEVGPESTECDRVDNDCDGIIDEGVALEICPPCAANDSICDGLSEDCDEAIDENASRVGTCLPLACPTGGVVACVDAVGVCSAGAGCESSCTDGIDNDDGDTDIDCADTDCAMEVSCGHVAPGSACTSDADCASLGDGAWCLTGELPGGYCLLPCTSDADCETGSLCFENSGLGGGICVAGCLSDQTCADPRSTCRPEFDRGICIPRCSSNADCDGGVCDTNSGDCGCAAETCNGNDDDCDGVIDNGLLSACGCAAAVACVLGVPVDCAERLPENGDATCDGFDDDCDGSINEDYPSTSVSCGDCGARAMTACIAGVETGCTSDACDEDCHNGTDDDNDGALDCNDTSCTHEPQCVAMSEIGRQCASDTDCPVYSYDLPEVGELNFQDCHNSRYSMPNVGVPNTSVGYCLGLCSPDLGIYCAAGSVCAENLCLRACDWNGGCGDPAQVCADYPTLTGGVKACVPSCDSDAQCPDGKSCVQLQPNTFGTLSAGVCRGCADDDTTCDGQDDDCDGAFDEDWGDNGSHREEYTCGVGVCTRYGGRMCSLGDVYEDGCAVTEPGNLADFDNDLDDDCDGAVDEDINIRPTFLKFWTGTFTRNDTSLSIATSLDFDPETGAVKLLYWGDNQLRVERRTTDPDDSRAAYLFEGRRTSYLRYSDDLNDPYWARLSLRPGSDGDGVVNDNALAPDGSKHADTILLSDDPLASLQTVTDAPFDPEVNWTASVFHRSGDGRLDLFRRGGGGISVSLDATVWTRFDVTTDSGTGPDAPRLVLGGNSTTPANVDLVAWGPQVEVGSFPSSYIRTSENLDTPDSTRAADVLTFDAVPAQMQNTAWTVDVYPLHGSSDGKSLSNLLGLSNATFGLFAFGGSGTTAIKNHYIALHYDVYGASYLRFAQGAIGITDIKMPWDRHQKLTLIIDPMRGVSVNDVWHTVPVPMQVPPQGRLMVGGLFAGDYTQAPGTSAFARISEPFALNVACTSDANCTESQTCGYRNGDSFGSTDERVCWPDVCATDFANHCGTVTSECGLCNSCTSNQDCSSGETCGLDNGAAFGRGGLRVCWPRDCDYPEDRATMCGTITSECGVCPACVPDCGDRVCGDDGCGGSCGDTPSGKACTSGLLNVAKTLPPIPAGVTTAHGVGSMPGRFFVDDNGDANYEIPIALPPGRGGLQPELSFQYNSSRGNGYLGVGWLLNGLSAISRCNETVAQDGVAASPQFSDDVFCLDGQRLVKVGGSFVTHQDHPFLPDGTATLQTEWRTERDNFARVYSHTLINSANGFNPDAFEVQHKDGRRMLYSFPCEGWRAQVPGQIDSCLPRDMLTWPLRRVVDRSGNEIGVRYSVTIGTTGMSGPSAQARRFRSYRPVQVVYNGGDASVDFEYGPRDGERSRHVAGFRAGHETIVSGRLTRVVVGYQGERTSAYNLTYVPDAPRSRLASIARCGRTDGTCLAPTTFDYSAVEVNFQSSKRLDDAYADPLAQDGIYLGQDFPFHVIEANGDGIDDVLVPVSRDDTDILEVRDVFTDWWLLQSRRTASGVTHDFVPTGIRLHRDWHSVVGTPYGSHGHVTVADFDGDGRDELFEHDYVVDEDDEAWGDGHYSFVNVAGGFSRETTDIAREGPSWILDLDGDGRLDLLVCDVFSSPNSWRFYLGPAGRRFSEADRQQVGDIGVECPAFTVVADLHGDGANDLFFHRPAPPRAISFSDGTLHVEPVDTATLAATDALGDPLQCGPTASGGDVNGDGQHDGTSSTFDPPGLGVAAVATCLGNGHGGYVVSAQTSTLEYSPQDVRGAYWFDVNADGRDDYLVALNNFPNWRAMLSDGEGLTSTLVDVGAIVSDWHPSGSYHARALQGDFDADGSPDLFEHNVIHFGPSRQSGLIAITTGTGARTDITYASLTDPDVYTHETTCNEFQTCRHPRRTVVKRHHEQDAFYPDGTASGTREYVYQYAGARHGFGGRGWLGFSKRERTTRDFYNHAISRQDEWWYDNQTFDVATQSFPFAGRVKTHVTKVSDSASGNTYYTSEEHEFEIAPTVGRAYQVWAGETAMSQGTVETETFGTGTIEVLQVINQQRVERIPPDDFGNIPSTITHRKLDGSDDYVTWQTFKHESDPSLVDQWLVGLVVESGAGHVLSGTFLSPQLGSATRVSEFTYDTDGLLISATQQASPAAPSLVTSYGRDSYGNVTSVVESDAFVGDPDQAPSTARVTRIAYDDTNTFPHEITNALDQSPTIVDIHPSTGHVYRVTDANGLITESWDDDLGRPVLSIEPDGTRTRTIYRATYTGKGMQVDVRSESAAQQQLGRAIVTYDAGGRAERREYSDHSGVPIISTADYDTFGRPEAVSRPHKADVTNPGFYTLTYDERGRIRFVTDPNNATTETCYGDFDRVCTRDARGFTRCTVADSLGRVIRSVDPDSVPEPDDDFPLTHVPTPYVPPDCRSVIDEVATYQGTTYHYGYFDAPEAIVDVTGANITSIFTDAATGLRTSIDDPDTGTESYTYDRFRQLETVLDANQNLARFQYDKLGRRTHRVDVDMGGIDATTRWIWDYGDNNVQDAGELMGALSETISPDGVRTRDEYDAFARLDQTLTTIAGTTYTTDLEYDQHSRLSSITYPLVPGASSALRVDHEYSSVNGQLIRVHGPDLASDASYWKLDATTAHDELLAESFGNGVRTSYEYDASGRVLNISSNYANTLGSPFQDMTYGYDAVGNVDTRYDGIRVQMETVAYDHLDRILNVNGGDAITYDAIGNIASRPAVGAYGYGSSHPHAPGTVGTRSYGYDNVGNRTTKSADGVVHHTKYTRFNKPFEFSTVTPGSGGTSITLVDGTLQYDAGQNRVVKQTPTTNTTYVGGLYERREQFGSPTEHVFYIGNGARPVAQVTVSETAPNTRAVAYLHSEGLGSTQFVTAGDGTLAGLQILDERSYDVWGAQRQLDWPTNSAPLTPPLQSSIYNVGYTGHESDPEFGLINMQGRIYDPQISKFTTADPFVWHADSQGLNRYAYVLNNPLSLVDPSGFQESGICAGACGIDSMGDIHPTEINFDVGSEIVVQSGGGFEPTAPPQPTDGMMAPYLAIPTSNLSYLSSPVMDSPLGGALVDTGRLYEITLGDFLSDTGPIILGMLPGFGELSDAQAALDDQNATWVRVLSVGSLGLSLVTAGTSPNVGGTAARSVDEIPATFIGQANGPSIVVPRGATGPLPADSGLGVKYVGGSGGPGLNPSASNLRIMEPTAPAGPSPGYPQGYASYSNAAGQTINPATGRTVARSSPWWHIPLDWLGL